VLAHGPLWPVDSHALPFAGDVLLAGREVVYSLDLPRRRGGDVGGGLGDGGMRSALVIADPEGDLPGARREAAAVAPLLAHFLEVDRLSGAEATGPALRGRLAGAGLLHYAGHGVSAGWDSRLPLAARGALTVDDVLVLDPGPRLVVLSGCETAAVPADTPAEGMGLAHAFLIAGAEAVVATVRRVPDDASSALVAGFYRELAGGGTPAAALRRAQLERARLEKARLEKARLEKAQPGGDPAWASFRVIEP
jgi:CHAT domain-containing protein